MKIMVFGMTSLVVLLASCAPTTTGPSTAGTTPAACTTVPAPKVVIAEFGNTTSYYGVTVSGVESAATARLITLLENSGCYEVLEKSVLQELIEEQGLESMAPEELAKAAGAAYVITGAVTEVTLDRPQVGFLGVSVGSVVATVKVDVRATDVITGQVVVSMTGQGNSQNANFALSRLPVGPISFNNNEVGPLLATASEQAIGDVVTAIRRRF